MRGKHAEPLAQLCLKSSLPSFPFSFHKKCICTSPTVSVLRYTQYGILYMYRSPNIFIILS